MKTLSLLKLENYMICSWDMINYNKKEHMSLDLSQLYPYIWIK